MMMKLKEKPIGIIGLLSVGTLITALLVFCFLNKDFSFLEDYISKLGASGQPRAIWFNLIGFVAVGVLLSIFGFLYGYLLNDKLLSFLLSLFGLGFAFTAIPIDLDHLNLLFQKLIL